MIRHGLLTAAALLCAPALAQTYITNEGDAPAWSQHHDYRATYANQATNIETGPGTNVYVVYSGLAGDARTFLPRLGTVAAPGGAIPFVQVNPPAPRRKFGATDYYDTTHGGWNLAGGGWHCAPTSTGIYIEWARANILTRLADRGGEFASIDDFARQADTNDYHQTIDTTANRMHFGTNRGPMIDAANTYADNSSIWYGGIWGPTFGVWNWSVKGFRQVVDRGHAVVLYYANLDPVTGLANGGHVVVGIGYDAGTSEIIIRDPWHPNGGPTRRKAWNTITQLGGGGGTLYGGVEPPDPPSGPISGNWVGARMALFEVPDWGDAPSSYLVGEDRTAANRSSYREWLGERVSREVEPFHAEDDEDDEANVNDHDHFDDGAVLSPLIGGRNATITFRVSSVADMSRDDAPTADLPPVLYVNAWIDWNNDTVWSPDELVAAATLAADFDGIQQLPPIQFPVPLDYPSPAWLRVRLTRGQNPGPYGLAEFGEIEDSALVVRCAGDIDGDDNVALNDLALLLAVFGSCSGDGQYDAAADFNGNGCVDLTDLAILLSAFGMQCS